MNELLSNVLTRKSIYQFDSQQISQKELQDILEAGQFVSGAIEEQALEWRFTVIQNQILLQRMKDACRAVFSKRSVDAPLLRGIGAAPTMVILSGYGNDIDSVNAINATVGNMMLAANKIDVGCCWIPSVQQVFDQEEGKKLKREMEIPEACIYSSGALFGYKASEKNQGPVGGRLRGSVHIIP